jgi:hypothetical protein
MAIKKGNKTTNSIAAIERLRLLVYYLKHQAWTSCNDHSLLTINHDDLDSL